MAALPCTVWPATMWSSLRSAVGDLTIWHVGRLRMPSVARVLRPSAEHTTSIQAMPDGRSAHTHS